MARWFLTVACLLVTIPAGAFQTPGPNKAKRSSAASVPKLPGAVTRLPDAIASGAPFDVTAYFTAPSPELNAAPLYLDALFEFDPVMANCFPPGAETNRRKQLAATRMKSLQDQYAAFTKDPTSVDIHAIDRVIADLNVGMRKLENAQRRPRCFFESGIDYSARLPHAEAVSEVARLVILRARRNVDRGNLDQALPDLDVLLRLARDLRPRGPAVCQDMACTLTEIGYSRVIQPVLASPLFRERHARQLLELLVKHQRASINGYEEGVKSEYLLMAVSMNAAAREPHQALGEFEKSQKDAGNESIGENDIRIRMLADAIKKMTPAQINVVNGRVARVFRDLLALKNVPASKWPEKEPRPRQMDDGSAYGRWALRLMPDIPFFSQHEARTEVTVGAAECLVAIKLWNYRNKKPPADLAAVTKAGGLPRVPVDPYSGLPLRMAIIDGEPVVYSVGKDGRDDGGRIDSDADRKPGDHLFRLPPLEKAKR
jgi:hypothetical protein